MITKAMTSLSFQTSMQTSAISSLNTVAPRRFSSLLDRGHEPAPRDGGPTSAPAPAPVTAATSKIGPTKPPVPYKDQPTTLPPEAVEADGQGEQEAQLPGQPPRAADRKGPPMRPAATRHDGNPSATSKAWHDRLPPFVGDIPADDAKLAAAEKNGDSMSAAELTAFLASLPGAVAVAPSQDMPAEVVSDAGSHAANVVEMAEVAKAAKAATTASTTLTFAASNAAALPPLTAGSAAEVTTAPMAVEADGNSKVRPADIQAKLRMDTQARDDTMKFDAQWLAAQGGSDRSNPTKPYVPPTDIIDPDLIFVVGPAAPGAAQPNPASLLPPAPPTDGNQVASARLQASPGSAEFAPQLGAQLSSFVRDGIHHAKLELNPAEMGPLTVQIRLDGDTAHVHMAAEHSGTREALELAMPLLAGSLRDNGLTLTGGGVSDQPRPQSQESTPAPRTNRINRVNGTDDRSALERSLAGVGAATARRRGVVDLLA
jgi:flagellar hook-length control protein FliK